MILLQILDEGSLTDSQGRKVDFKVHYPFISRRTRKLMSFYFQEHKHLPHKQPRLRHPRRTVCNRQRRRHHSRRARRRPRAYLPPLPARAHQQARQLNGLQQALAPINLTGRQPQACGRRCAGARSSDSIGRGR